MGKIIGASADIEKVEEHVRETLRRAEARGGAVAEMAKGRLGAAVAGIDEALAALREATELEAKARAGVMAEKEKSDVGIGVVRDGMWNALERPRFSTHLDQVFPEGIKTYTSGELAEQPVMMQILESRIRRGTAAQWTKEQLDGWAGAIATLRGSFAKVVEAYRPTRAAAAVARVGYRSAVRVGHAGLRNFKRDLLSMGFGEAHVHDLIPDAGRTAERRGAGDPGRTEGSERSDEKNGKEGMQGKSDTSAAA
jgi:hypothetical protein